MRNANKPTAQPFAKDSLVPLLAKLLQHNHPPPPLSLSLCVCVTYWHKCAHTVAVAVGIEIAIAIGVGVGVGAGVAGGVVAQIQVPALRHLKAPAYLDCLHVNLHKIPKVPMASTSTATAAAATVTAAEDADPAQALPAPR